jgi:circadian clock protein KaiB
MARNKSRNGSSERTAYVFHLYISGVSPRSKRALANVKEICEERLKGRYDLKVIDIFQSSVPLEPDGIVAAPTLIRKNPLPVRRFIGEDLADKDKLLSGLAIDDAAKRNDGRASTKFDDRNR